VAGRVKNQLRGCIRISAKGRELYRFINMIHQSSICCFGQHCRSDVFYGEIYRSDLSGIEEIAAECGIELTSAEFTTLSSRLLRYRRRIGLLIGVIAAVFTVYYFSSVVVTIEVYGNSSVSESDILAALDDLGIRSGARINDLDLRYCANELRVRVDGISWAAIRHTGNRIVVDVTEVIEPPEKPQKRLPCNIVSKKNAKITSFTLLDGFLMHKIGDYVAEGTLLVNGVSVSNTGRTLLHHAMGEVIGIYDETVQFSGTYEPVLTVPTGRSRDEKYLRLFSLDIPLFFSRCKYGSSSCETAFAPFVLFGRELPVGVVSKHIEETELTGCPFTPEELEADLNRKIFIYEKNFIGTDTKVISRTIERHTDEAGMTFTVHYTLEGNIGVEKELMIK
jgi:similar to stage IV sporulation protein